MRLHDFIFTRKTPDRYLRHIVFWVILYLPLMGVTCVQIIGGSTPPFRIWPFIFSQQQLFLSNLYVDIVFTYFIVYYISPRYLGKGKYTRFALIVLGCTILSYSISGILRLLLLEYRKGSPLVGTWQYFQFFISAGFLFRCSLFFFIRQLKIYYSQTEWKIFLLKEKSHAEMQLLKAQVHPHFLFNTLNNIYSFTLNKSPLAGQLVYKLSDTLRYMITDCESAYVPLANELKMLKDYVSLEQVRYGNRLRLRLNISGQVANKQIVPLLMIPFLENSFKHGTSKVLDNPWIDLNIEVMDDHLYFYLANARPAEKDVPAGNRNGIGLRNVRKRLELMYPDDHQLDIIEGSHSFSVTLKVPLKVSRVEVINYQRPVLQTQ